MLLVILPSKNEVGNISHVTQVVDAGIKEYFDTKKALILNVDSASYDDTVKTFLETDTSTPKQNLLMPRDKIGKGYNIKAGINFGLEKGYKTFLTFDTDLKSIEASWIGMFLVELHDRKNDYVVPVYKRNRFEGNTTNHFSSPLIYACWNKDIKQPIAGDFGFNAKVAREIYKGGNRLSHNQYGIDTMMTWTALAYDYKISQIEIGKKIHNPSFSKIVEMFEEVCSSTFFQINKYRDTIRKSLQCNQSDILGIGAIDEQHVARPSDEAIENLRKLSQAMLNKTGCNVAVEDVGEDIWTDCLSETVITLIEQQENDVSTVQNLVKETAAFYFARVYNYINSINNTDSDTIDYNLNMQKKMLSTKIRYKLGS